MTATMTESNRYRIGIDVGGTFTHAVAIDADHFTLVGKVKVHTTHTHQNGVGQGVVESLQLLMEQKNIKSDEVIFVAHSTTQATNSLLEGDVEKVAIISVGSGLQGFFTRRAASLGKIPISPGKHMETFSHHVNPNSLRAEADLEAFLRDMKNNQIRVVIVSGAFSVDDSAQEKAVAEFVRSLGFICTATHEVSQLYGVKIRTRTTAINASILPKMIDVANNTEREIRRLGIRAPFMIMRSDGGVMSIEEMRKKPILTLLSGPAAGIAAALRYLKISDGVFLEVGGTSTDISVIKNGRAITRSASIGGNRTFLKTLDCRTLGIGGGSIPRVQGSKVVDVGPRSAHIAQVKYAAFESGSLGEECLMTLEKAQIQPKKGDPQDYLVFQNNKDNTRVCFTPTCAANASGLVPMGDCARAYPGFPGIWDQLLMRAGVGNILEYSEKILRCSSEKIQKTVQQLLKEYKLQKQWVTLIGGGGGASALVPHLGKTLQMKNETAKDNDVISAIGVALGLIRETVEKSCVNPGKEDIYKIRQEACEKVRAQGADPSSIEVFIEVDSKKNIIRADAQGSIEFKQHATAAVGIGNEGLIQVAQEALGLKQKPRLCEQDCSESLTAAVVSVERRQLGLFKQEYRYGIVMDARGVVRLRISDAHLKSSTAESLVSDLNSELDHYTTFGDGGITYPYVYALLGDRIVDLSKLQSPAHFASVLEMEAREVPPKSPAVLIFSREGVEEA